MRPCLPVVDPQPSVSHLCGGNPNSVVDRPWQVRRNPEYQEDYINFYKDYSLDLQNAESVDNLLIRDVELRDKWKVNEIKAPTEKDCPFFLEPGPKQFQTTLTFNITLPIPPQIEMARALLESNQKMYIKVCKEVHFKSLHDLHKKGFIDGEMLKESLKIEPEKVPKERRFHWENFQIYLRLLDGELDGNSQDVLAATLYPQDSLPKARDKVKDQLAAARRLRDEEFNYIPLGI